MYIIEVDNNYDCYTMTYKDQIYIHFKYIFIGLSQLLSKLAAGIVFYPFKKKNDSLDFHMPRAVNAPTIDYNIFIS